MGDHRAIGDRLNSLGTNSLRRVIVSYPLPAPRGGTNVGGRPRPCREGFATCAFRPSTGVMVTAYVPGATGGPAGLASGQRGGLVGWGRRADRSARLPQPTSPPRCPEASPAGPPVAPGTYAVTITPVDGRNAHVANPSRQGLGR